MTKQRLLLWVVMTVLLAGLVLPAHAAPAPKEPAPKVGPKAGAISALLPVATITRGTGKAAVTNQAKKGDDLVWNDLVKTLKGGRARITLADQSILSLGSQAELKIVKHDDRSQQTALQLYGGRVRAEVAKITRQGGSFELRTPTAVAGVIGTDFGSDASSVGTTIFLCISGITQISSNDPGIPGSVQCAAGLTTSVTAGKPPTIPTNATPQQIQQLIQDTEPAIISAMSPTTAMPGTTFDAAINGTKMGSVNAVSVTGSGVTVSLSGAPTDTSVTVHMVIADNATPGPHTLTLTNPSGAASAAVFTILVPPTAAQSGDLKKPYHDLFDQERQTNKAGLTALIASVQQAVDQTLQQLQTANQGNLVDLAPATNNLNQQIAAIQNAINQAGGQVDQAVTSALATFDSQYQLAWNALLQRDPAAVPDDTFNQSLQAAYNQVNASLGQAFANISGSLNTNVQTATGTVTQVQQTWLATIANAAIVAPTPAVNNTEFSAFLGAAFGSGSASAPDAGRSRGNNGASIVRYQWVLCDSGYRPAQFGVPISANTTGCNPLPGYASTNSDFQFATCSLTAADYIARVTVTDTNNQQAAMDVKIHVLAATYDDPKARLLNLAAAYSNLNYTQFLAFFDESFSGYQTLSENLRTNLPKLASMNVLLNLSQSTITCNDAKLRADWTLNYNFKRVCQTFVVGETSVQSCSDPSVPFEQKAQLSVTMLRTPGVGWKIVDLQGDNGSLSNGATIPFPGPVAAPTDTSAPDLVVTAVSPTNASGAQPGLPPGPQSVTATVLNAGSAALTGSTELQFALGPSGSLGTTKVMVSGPIAAGATVQVTGTITVLLDPTLFGTTAQLVATVDPTCTTSPAESSCTNNTQTQTVTLVPPIRITQVNALDLLAGGPAQTLQVNVSDAATMLLNLPAGMTTSSPNPQTLSAGGTLDWVVQATLNASAATPLAPMTVTPVGIPVTQPIIYSLTGPTFNQTATPALLSGGASQALTVTVSVPGTFALNLPAGITTSSANPQTIAPATGNTLTWNLQASLATVTGASLATPITAGAYTFNAAYSVAGPTFVQSATPSLLAGGPAQALTVSVNIPGTFALTLPAGITTSSPNPQTITTATGGTLTWNIQSSLTATLGAPLTMPVAIGPYTFNAAYSVAGPTFVQSATPSLLAGGPAQALTVSVNIPGTFALTLPAGITTSSPNPQTITTATGGTLTWNIQSSLTATLGAPLTMPVAIGPYTFNAAYSVAGPTFVQSATPSLLAGGPAQALTVSVNIPGTFALTLPAGITTSSPNPQTITTATGGTLTWNLQADFTSLTGVSLSTPVTIGPVSFNVTYNNGAQANYVIQSISFTGHTPPFTGANGVQVGETLVINALVANVGNVSPTGQITVFASCSGGPEGNTACTGGGGGEGDPITTIAAPVAGTAVTATMIATTNGFVPGTYLGTVALTTTLEQSSTADDSLTLPFEAVDFNLSIVVPSGFLETQPGGGATQVRPLAGAPSTPTQNVLLGGTAQISVNLDETGNPTPFALLVTATTDNAAVTFPTPTVNVNPNSTVVTTLTTSPSGAVPVTAVYGATNHGVTKNAIQVLNYVTASVTPTNLFLNGPSDPLKLQMGQTSSACVITVGRPPSGCPANPDITLTVSSTPSFAGAAGNAATVTPPAPVSGFTATVTPATVTQGGTFDLRVAAAVGATPQVTALPVVVTLPNSNPPANVTYTLYVQAIGVPDLQVVSVTPTSRTPSANAPWLSGEGLDFTVVVRNGGNTASAGNEILTMNLNGYQVDPGARGAAVRVPALAPNTSTNIPVHAIAPDVGVGALSGGTLVTKVNADTAGDLNYADNSLTQNVAVSNWRLTVSNPGASDATPLVVTITSGGSSWSNQALVAGTADNGGAASGQFFNPTPGVVGSKLAITNFAAVPGANSFLVTVTTFDPTTQNGFYPAQVIVQLMDGGTVTAQRQATIHVQVDNFVITSPNYALGLTCTHNGASCVAGAGPATTIQVNGALTEQYIATVVPTCTPAPGVTCQGTADIVITDGTNTSTTPPQAKGQPFNSGAVFQLTANLDANGNITAGPAGGYSITVNGIQRSGATSPDAVGQTVPVPVNVGDVIITTNAGANGCTAVAPNGPPVQLTVSWDIASMGGFNAPSIAWEWENANHAAVGATPLSFTSPSGSSSGAPNYGNPPAFTISNLVPPGAAPPPDGLLLYFFAASVSNGTSSATKYFPFYFDASLSQSFCGAAGAARGSFTRINGSWSRSAVGDAGVVTLGKRLATGAAGGSVDLHVSAADVSFTPSIPKSGDTVQVRFRVRNDGTADAKGVPIALQVNGVTVASDTFDVGAGRTALGGLQWNSASLPLSASTRPAALRPARIGARTGSGPVNDAGGDSLGRPAGQLALSAVEGRVSALLVIDPQHTVQQKTTLDKSAPLAHFSMSSADGGAGGVAAGPSQRLLLEIQEGACAGMRLATGGVGPCGTADLELTIADIAKGTYMLSADSGVADQGASFGGVAQGSARATSELAGVAGHRYAVQLSGGRTAVITIDSIRNPRQLDAAARALFRNSAVLVMRGLGSDSGAAATGDVAGGMRGGATVFVQLSVQVQ